MKRLRNWLSVLLLTVSAISSLLATAGPVPVQAATQANTKSTAAKTTPPETMYKYVVQPGDSYSLMARKAVQTYGLKNKVTLSRAKIIAAETHLTQDAGSPYLDIGEAIQVKETTVKSWVDKVQKLSPTEEAAWAVYAAGANFNTNAVGQAK
jgi:hypothetical protein